MKLAIKSGVSYTCNYCFIDSSASWGMVSHDIYPCYDNPSQLQSWEKIITRKTPRGNVQNGMLMWVSKCVSVCGCGPANVCTIVCVLTCCSVWAVSEHPSTLTLVLSSSNKEVLDLTYEQGLITLFLSLSFLPSRLPPARVSSPSGCEDGGEDETSQPSADPAVHHAVQECKGGLQERLRYLMDCVLLSCMPVHVPPVC